MLGLSSSPMAVRQKRKDSQTGTELRIEQATSPAVGIYLWSRAVTWLAAALGAFLLLYHLAEDRLGADGAQRTVLYLAIFPMALFLQAVYSESLYLLLVLAAFLLAERARFAGAGVAAGLAILTRV